MNWKVRWTEKAKTDLLAIWDYVATQSQTYADSVCQRILDRPDQLIQNPRSGSIVPEFQRDDIRELFVFSFRLVYRIAESEVRILTVIHGARQLSGESLDSSQRDQLEP